MASQRDLESIPGDFRVGDWIARPRQNHVEGPAGPVPVEAKSMAVLVDLARYAGEVRTRQELLEAVWGDAFVTEEVLSHCIWDLRRALGDNARKPRLIQTIPKRGYRLIAPVSWLEPSTGETSRYRLLEQLGSGAMGVVWKAEDTLLHRAVALKFLPPEWSRDPAAKARFLKEARIAAALDHPNICTLHEAGETDDGRLFLVLGFYQGETLEARLARGPLPWREAVTVAIGAARGLGAAHAAGIIHRDVKTANMILALPAEATRGEILRSAPPDRAPTESLKILDFGIARFADETQHTQTGPTSDNAPSPGTPAYRSPEQTLGDAVDHRSDIWSLGVVLTEMLTGRKPFRGDYEQAVVHAILNHEPQPLSELAPQIPSRLSSIVDRMLNRDVDRRYPDMEAVVSDLTATIRDSSPAEDVASTSSAHEPSPTALELPTFEPAGSQRARPSPRFRWSAVLLLLLSTVLLAATADRWWRTDTQPIRIAVLQPELRSDTDAPGIAVAASGLLVAILSGLAEFEHLIPLDPSQAVDQPRSAIEAARAAAADEVLASSIEDHGGLYLVNLRRIRSEDGRVEWAESFKAQSEPQAARLLANMVRSRLRIAYPNYRVRNSSPEFEVRDEDYWTFLEIRQRRAAGESISADFETLERMTATSPRFLEAYLTAVQVATIAMRDQRDEAYQQRAFDLIAKAEALAPGDPRPVNRRFHLEVAAGQLAEATTTLAALRLLIPGEASLLRAEATLHQARGDIESAVETLRAAVALRPSWSTLAHLADLQYRRGEVEAARTQLEQLLEVAPGNRWGLSKLAEFELLYGDLEASVTLYQRLIARHEKRNYWTNLGIAQFLLGRYEAAVASYLEALALAPDHPVVLANLAEAEVALGYLEPAREHCQAVVTRFEFNDKEAPLGPIDSMTKAFCLARLGEPRHAVEITLRTLQAHPQHAEVAYQAAMVYALTGDRHSALVNAERARSLGIKPRWFRVPGFASIQADPAFEALQIQVSSQPSG